MKLGQWELVCAGGVWGDFSIWRRARVRAPYTMGWRIVFRFLGHRNFPLSSRDGRELSLVFPQFNGICCYKCFSILVGLFSEYFPGGMWPQWFSNYQLFFHVKKLGPRLLSVLLVGSSVCVFLSVELRS